MNDSMLATMAGIAGGLEKASATLMQLQIAKHKLDQENQIFSLSKKQKELEIKKAEIILGPEQLAAEREKLKAETAAQTALFNLRSMQVSTAQQKQQRDIDTYKKYQQILDKVLSGGSIPAGLRLNMGPGYSISQASANKGGTVINLGPEDNPGSADPNANNDVEDFLAGIK